MGFLAVVLRVILKVISGVAVKKNFMIYYTIKRISCHEHL